VVTNRDLSVMGSLCKGRLLVLLVCVVVLGLSAGRASSGGGVMAECLR
jgi:hypothetical protein